MELTMNEKYKVKSPIITPEYFPTAYNRSEERINTLLVSADPTEAPTVVFADLETTISDTFPEGNFTFVHFPNGVVMVVDPLLQWKTVDVNLVATTYVKSNLLTFQGDIFTDSVFGDVLLFSCYDYDNDVFNDGAYSVSYETVQEMLIIYVRQKQTTKTETF